MNLKRLYHDPKFPGSLSGLEKFYREVKNIHPQVKRKQIVKFLKTQKSYTLHKAIKKPRKYRRTIVFRPRDLWQIDLLDIQKHAHVNDGFRYICVIIDCFTRFVWAKPLKFKTARAVVKALALLLLTERPKLIQGDEGKEFFNKDFERMIEAFGIKLYHTYTDKKVAIVERVQRTLRNRIGRMYTARKNYIWIDKIDDIVHAYNNTYHRSIQMNPADVDKEHVANLFYNSIPKANKVIKFKIGDRVRITIKNAFKKNTNHVGKMKFLV